MSNEARLNFDENGLDKDSTLYDLYSRLYNGMKEANKITPPSFDNPPQLPDGSIDIGAIDKKMAEYSDILMKNSAYLYANSIVATASGGGGGSGSGIGFVSRNGDSMSGLLTALYGFEAGSSGTKIFETIKSENIPKAIVTGSFYVNGKSYFQEELHLPDKGLFFSDKQFLHRNGDTVYLDNPKISVKSDVTVDGSLSVGDFCIDSTGLHYQNYEFYHSGNSNKSDVDWTAFNAIIHGNATIHGTAAFLQDISALNGFSLGVSGTPVLYVDKLNRIAHASDIDVLESYGICLGGDYLFRLTGENNQFVSFSAPGKVIKLGDFVEDTATQRIDLQAGIYDKLGECELISVRGDGKFMNSFVAGHNDVEVMKTFGYTNGETGIIVPKQLRFGNGFAPVIYGDKAMLRGKLPFKTEARSPEAYEELGFSLSYEKTTSQFRDLSLLNSATLAIDTEGEFIAFQKPLEVAMLTIKSDKYKTCIKENVLFFDSSKFLEGTPSGIRTSCDLYVNGNGWVNGGIRSLDFASGFSGYGWGILQNSLMGGYTATFDELVIRKKMRIFDLEVQKISFTNGSLWVSDSCSGDEVREI